MISEKEKRTIIELHEQYSIYTPWSNKKIFKKIVKELAKPFDKEGIDKVIGIESRGFIFAAAVAYYLNAGLVVVRKKNHKNIKQLMLHEPTLSESFIDYSKKQKTIIIEDNPISILKKDKILIVDDWFGTGAHGEAIFKLIKRINRGKIVGISVLYNSMSIEKETYLSKKCKLNYLIKYKPQIQSSKFLFSLAKIFKPK